MPATVAAPSANDLQSFEDFLSEKALTCVHEPEGLLHYKYVTPTYAITAGADDQAKVAERSTTGHYLQMYDWDSCFFSQAADRLGIKDLPKSVVGNFLSLKKADGYVPRTVSPQRIWDAGDLCKPFLCQALMGYQKNATGHLPGEFVQDLDCYLKYFERTRRHESGLYHWRNVLESGVDDNLALLEPGEAAKDENEAVGNFADSRLLAIDLNSYLVAEFAAFSVIAGATGHKDLAVEYHDRSMKLVNLIEEKMWNASINLYCNIDPKTNEQFAFRAWTGMTPVLMGFANPERTKKVIEQNMLDEKHFLRHCGISSVAASEPLYNQAKRGLYGRVIVSNWQGPMWVLPNALAVRALTNNDRYDAARDVAARVLTTLITGMHETGTMFENYNADTGQTLWAPQFMSWNVLALELIALLKSHGI